MSEETAKGCTAVIAAVAFATFLGVFALAGYAGGYDEGAKAEKCAAIKAGVARYDADPTTGKVKFAYITKDK